MAAFRGLLPIRVLCASTGGGWLGFQGKFANAKYVYSFQSAVGIFWIRPERDKSWGLYIEGEGTVELLGYYGSAFAAADSVCTQSTGWNGWDRLKRIDAPPTLLLWSKKLVK
ncbi:MAG: hypothetical protein WCA20_07335 [Candidatus Sulfotelmatobacter sp.]